MYSKIVEPTPFGPVALVWDQFDGDPKAGRVAVPRFHYS